MIKIIKASFFSSVQDLGRYDFIQYGVPISGAMDKRALQLSNLLLGNNRKNAAIEFCNPGASLHFKTNTQITITGANFSPTINKQPIELNKVITVLKDDIITFEKKISGCRCYLSVIGGIQSEKILNSRSFYKNISSSEFLKDTDTLIISENPVISKQTHSKLKIDSLAFTQNKLDVFKGPEFEMLTKKQKKAILNREFTISNLNNRMAYQLNELVNNKLSPIITSATLPGTIQLTPNGQLIVLMRDCQTTGGYPRVLQLSENSINILAQKSTTQKITFILSY